MRLEGQRERRRKRVGIRVAYEKAESSMQVGMGAALAAAKDELDYLIRFSQQEPESRPAIRDFLRRIAPLVYPLLNPYIESQLMLFRCVKDVYTPNELANAFAAAATTTTTAAMTTFPDEFALLCPNLVALSIANANANSNPPHEPPSVAIMSSSCPDAATSLILDHRYDATTPWVASWDNPVQLFGSSRFMGQIVGRAKNADALCAIMHPPPPPPPPPPPDGDRTIDNNHDSRKSASIRTSSPLSSYSPTLCVNHGTENKYLWASSALFVDDAAAAVACYGVAIENRMWTSPPLPSSPSSSSCYLVRLPTLQTHREKMRSSNPSATQDHTLYQSEFRWDVISSTTPTGASEQRDGNILTVAAAVRPGPCPRIGLLMTDTAHNDIPSCVLTYDLENFGKREDGCAVPTQVCGIMSGAFPRRDSMRSRNSCFLRLSSSEMRSMYMYPYVRKGLVAPPMEMFPKWNGAISWNGGSHSSTSYEDDNNTMIAAALGDVVHLIDLRDPHNSSSGGGSTVGAMLGCADVTLVRLIMDRNVIVAGSSGSFPGWMACAWDIRKISRGSAGGGAVCNAALKFSEPGVGFNRTRPSIESCVVRNHCVSFGAGPHILSYSLTDSKPLSAICTLANRIISLDVLREDDIVNGFRTGLHHHHHHHQHQEQPIARSGQKQQPRSSSIIETAAEQNYGYMVVGVGIGSRRGASS